MSMLHHNQKQNGFALLMTLIVVGVIISVGLTILDLTIKQLKLSTNSKDSEIGLPDGDDVPDIEQTAGTYTIDCFGSSDAGSRTGVTYNADAPVIGASGVDRYNYSFDWGSAGALRCTEITMVLFTSDNSSGGVTVTGTDMAGAVPGYPNSDKKCEPGGRCTVTSVRGYNKSCSNIGTYGTIQREVLLES